MISVRPPDAERVRRFLASQESSPLSYPEVGATANGLPAGYDIDRTTTEWDGGSDEFEVAKQRLREWRQFQLGWVQAMPLPTPLVENQEIAVLGRAFGCWWWNACRILYTLDENAAGIHRFGFAYGTLPSHVEQGEERFLLEWDSTSRRIRFEILAFSRPRHWATRIGYPLVRRKQKRFGRESAAAFFKAVQPQGTVPKIVQADE